MKYILFFGLITFLFAPRLFSQNSYACFQNDSIKSLKISVLFDKKQKAKYVKYAGQKDSIQLFYSKIHRSRNPGGIPAVYWAETYLEKDKGKVTGEYTFTNAGTYQLDVTYRRKKDKREFYFAIIEDFPNQVIPFRSTPCF